MLTDTMILGYTRNRTLNLIYTLANYGADAEAYDEILRLAQQARDDLDAGRDPADRLADINGQIVEL